MMSNISFHLSIFFKLPVFQQGTLTQAVGASMITVALLEIKKKKWRQSEYPST